MAHSFGGPWLAGEIIVFGISFYMTNNIKTAMISGFLGAVLSGLIIFQSLRKEANSQRNSDNDKREED